MVKRFRFGKRETSGKTFATFPIRTIYKFSPALEEAIIQVGVTANKRNFKKAVDRNKIKRLVREAYRLQKEDLLVSAKELKVNGSVFFMYTDKTIASFTTIKEAMYRAINVLKNKLAEANAEPF